MKIAVVQMTSADSIEENYKSVEKIVRDIVSNEKVPPKIVFFPENTLYFRIHSDEVMPLLNLQDEVFLKLERLSSELKMSLHLTSAIHEAGRIWNASVFIEPDKKTRLIYKKIHLFDIELEGRPAIRESDVFAHGESAAIFEVDEIKFGSSICYDIRFSELYAKYAQQEAHAILVPAAFLVPTGKAHWLTLLKARAIESQCYVIAPAQYGEHLSVQYADKSRQTFGHSCVIGPWGDVLSLKETGTGYLVADLDVRECEKIRRQIPMKNHRRLGV